MNRFATSLFAWALAIALLCLPPIGCAQEPPSGPGNTPGPASQTDFSPNGLPESPGATQNNTQEANPAVSSTSTPADTGQKPGGAAAAPAVEVTGNAVSRPAGSAIAPPKQRQVRSFLIKMGLIAGAGVALGTVAALSLSSPARVPGSH